VDVSTRPELITQWHATTVPWFVFNQAHSFAGPLPELVLAQRLQDLMGTSAEGESSY
jgi:predicted DsbA family dithiol-disulfide isomerase